jgi:hypothetical protein
MMSLAGNAGCMEEMRSVYKMLIDKPNRKRSLRKLTRRWKYNIKVTLREGGWEYFARTSSRLLCALWRASSFTKDGGLEQLSD